MASVQRSQTDEFSQRGPGNTKAPMNELTVKVIRDSASPHGGETDAAGDISLGDGDNADKRAGE